ncbi:hypothetical protein SLEP1_g4704 [Rubroshorea leprosula]|uniref:Uncharacterized protein n=1 Tax=Rubroshorea leprosula TaxID=152421 RepID=A0AAV5HYG7_9ROSI|nr:hypothetical protein SLEP1_g4704 [Rubroshorea leprosula]
MIDGVSERLETGLSSRPFGLTWLLPERFSTSEIGPEAGFVIFG